MAFIVILTALKTGVFDIYQKLATLPPIGLLLVTAATNLLKRPKTHRERSAASVSSELPNASR